MPNMSGSGAAVTNSVSCPLMKESTPVARSESIHQKRIDVCLLMAWSHQDEFAGVDCEVSCRTDNRPLVAHRLGDVGSKSLRQMWNGASENFTSKDLRVLLPRAAVADRHRRAPVAVEVRIIYIMSNTICVRRSFPRSGSCGAGRPLVPRYGNGTLLVRARRQ